MNSDALPETVGGGMSRSAGGSMHALSARSWRWYVAALLAVTVGYLFTPDTWLQSACYDTIALSGVAALILGVRWHRAAGARLWLAFAAALTVIIGGDFTFALYARAFHLSPYPAPADALYLVGTTMAIAALAVVVRRRLSDRDHASVVEATIIAGAFALIAWVYLMKPVTRSNELTAAGKLVAVGYPVLDLLLLAVLARLLVGGGARNGAFRLLAAGTTLYLMADYAWAFTDHFEFEAGTLTSHLMDAGYLLAFGLYGAAGLHPAIRDLATPVQVVGRRFSRLRVLLLTAATLIAPALLGWQAWHNEYRVADATAIMIGCIGMFLLVVTRMIILVRQVEVQSSVLEQQAAQLGELAQRDALTGLANRRAYEHALPIALDQARRDGRPLTLAVIDLDHFKRYNDGYGHQAGDLLLKEASAAWAGALRSGELLARYGGEEFVVLLAGVAPVEAVALLDRLRPFTPAGQTFSAGIATWNGNESSDGLFARADAALYAAKAAGRDRAELAEEAFPPPAADQPVLSR
jgi:diguanylate cyclase (GGDEF)-like protein